MQCAARVLGSPLHSTLTRRARVQAGKFIDCHGQCFASGSQPDGECTLDVQMDASVFQNGTIGYYYSQAWLVSVAQMWAKGPTAAVYV